ncbi:class I SAM-dependent methyltransferase [Kutzneria sp. CA-103260]|uniref:class I SAM-dependent methyltransferase n=1 Tax=Kutzneria sp. CA-103260 TaxID=2802641 RepID=UPI001BA55529|nr:class I SAM-dependent methyltransferase [Kutzneria sp. CA-103260]QUQ62800.1 Ubiquinone biosynthesis O-methyltransferase, mitochondrial [Kutzneria sp. CA-103260]
MAESDEQYDALGQTYERAKHIPTGLAEQATFLSALPDLAGRSVLDVACGTGFYPRVFADLGAAEVVAVDSSAEMVAYANHREDKEPRGIKYRQLDAAELPVLGGFDIVTAVWLLGYADDPAALDRMTANLAANLAPGGTLVVLVPNPDADFDVLAGPYGRYGYDVVRTGSATFRQPVSVRVLDEPAFAFDSFFWPVGAFEGALGRAGLVEITRAPTIVPVDERGEEFWADLRQSPSFAVFTAKSN